MADYSDKSTLDKCQEILLELFDNMPKDCIPILISNKEDLEVKAFETEDLCDISEEHNIELCFEVSVKTGKDMDDVFYEAACHANSLKASFIEGGLYC